MRESSSSSARCAPRRVHWSKGCPNSRSSPRALARGLDREFGQPFDQWTLLGAHRALELELSRMRDAERERDIGHPRVALAQGERLRELVEFVAGHFGGG